VSRSPRRGDRLIPSLATALLLVTVVGTAGCSVGPSHLLGDEGGATLGRYHVSIEGDTIILVDDAAGDDGGEVLARASVEVATGDENLVSSIGAWRVVCADEGPSFLREFVIGAWHGSQPLELSGPTSEGAQGSGVFLFVLTPPLSGLEQATLSDADGEVEVEFDGTFRDVAGAGNQMRSGCTISP